MAIVQISRITHRKGLIENLPQLAGGEFGWAVDDRRLFIGNGTLAEGAPVVGNTEILTEYSDILGLSSTYTYKGDAGGYTVQTGANPTGDVVRSLQDKLDEGSNVSVKDFGAVGDGVADDTAAINRALYELFCRESNEEIRRSLFIPAGVYRVSGTIKIPPFALIYGEGSDSSIIRYTSSDGSTIDDYVARTADSLQQIGANIGNNGATRPENITLRDFSFETTELQDILLIDRASDIVVRDMDFYGPLTEAELGDALENTSAIKIESTTSLVTKAVTLDAIHTLGTTYAFYTNYNTTGITVSNGWFETHYKGVVLGAAPINGGPRGVRVMHSLFDKIAAQGIEIGAVAQNVSGFNIFLDVGNDFAGAGNPTTVIVDINNGNNVSIGDLFERPDIDAATVDRIDLNNAHSIGFDGNSNLKLGNYERSIGYNTDLVDNTSTATAIFSVDSTRHAGFEVHYSLKRGDAVRTGKFTCSLPYGSNSISYNDEYTETAATGVNFSATDSSGTISFKYTTTSTGANADITYSIVKYKV